LSENKLIGETEFKELIDSNCIIHVAISEPLTTDIHKSVVSLEKLIKFMSIIYPQSAILDYRTLGFYKLFLNVQSIDELMEFVPQNVINVVNNKPDLAETLETFLDYSQNFVKTGELLYIHPKTVRYRIERLTEMLNLDLNDPTQLLTTHVALKVCSYAKNSN
jgi:purine catabolism regulator